MDLLKNACRIHTLHAVTRYLISNSIGRRDGAAKAHWHSELCQFYVALIKGQEDPDTVRRYYEADYQRVHTATQKLTDHLDTEIGFPLDEEPNYDALEPKFFERFHALAMEALSTP